MQRHMWQMKPSHFALDIWKMWKQGLIDSQEMLDFQISRLILLMFFGHGVNLIGAYDYYYSNEIDQLVWYVLNNCDQVDKYIKYVLKYLYVYITCTCFFQISHLLNFFELQNVSR